MSIHLRAIHDFPQDCNPHEADLLRRELAYYIYRRIGRTRITVHLEGYFPTVPYPQVQEFFARVFGDLIRLERLNPQRIHDRLRLTARGSENATILKQEAKAAFRIAFYQLDRAAYRTALFRYFTVQPHTGRHIYHYNILLPKAPGQLKRGHEPHPMPHAPATPDAPRIKMNKPIGGHLATTRPCLEWDGGVGTPGPSSWRQKPGRVFRVKVGGQFPPEPFLPPCHHTTPSEKTCYRRS